MSGPRKIEELLADSSSELGELVKLSTLLLLIDRAHEAAAELPDLVDAERRAGIASALSTARREVLLALIEHIERKEPQP